MSRPIDVFTCVTKLHPGYHNLEASVRLRKGWTITPIGKGVPWKGWITRMKLYRDTALWVAQHVHPNHVIVFLDAYDILCLRDSDQFLQAFQEKGFPILAGCESICFFLTCRPTSRWKHIHNISQYINGGCIIGEAYAIYEAYRWCLEKGYHKDDQIALSHYMDAYPHQITLDITSQFVYNDLFGIGNIQIQAQDSSIRLSVKGQDIHPYFIHFPGLMVLSSTPLVPWKFGKPPANYSKIGQLLLDDNFIDYQPLYAPVYQSSIIAIILLFLLIIGVVVFLSITCRRTHRTQKRS